MYINFVNRATRILEFSLYFAVFILGLMLFNVSCVRLAMAMGVP